MSCFYPCSGCDRHLRCTEITCPFCGAEVVFKARELPASTAPAMSRAAVLFAGATALAACGKAPADHELPAPQPIVNGNLPDGGFDQSTVIIYGPAPVTSQAEQVQPVQPVAPPDAGPTQTRESHEPVSVPPYSAPPVREHGKGKGKRKPIPDDFR